MLFGDLLGDFGSFVIESSQSKRQLGLRYTPQQEYQECSGKVWFWGNGKLNLIVIFEV